MTDGPDLTLSMPLLVARTAANACRAAARKLAKDTSKRADKRSPGLVNLDMQKVARLSAAADRLTEAVERIVGAAEPPEPPPDLTPAQRRRQRRKRHQQGAPTEVVVHALDADRMRALCGFVNAPPSQWPESQKWVGRKSPDRGLVTCGECQVQMAIDLVEEDRHG